MYIKTDFRDICQLNVSELAKQVSQLSDDEWYADSERQETFSIHKATQAIRLVDDIEPGTVKAKVHPLYAEFKQHVSPVLGAIKRNIDQRVNVKKLEKTHGKSRFVRVILARLNDGGEIPPHNDTGPSLMYVHRVHCPLITNSDCEFYVGESVRKLEVGGLVEINDRRKHAVKNRGTQKRIHLIADYYVPGERIIDIDGTTHICKL